MKKTPKRFGIFRARVLKNMGAVLPIPLEAIAGNGERAAKLGQTQAARGTSGEGSVPVPCALNVNSLDFIDV